jgi:hypothetical protein
MTEAEQVAAAFHEAYERLASEHGYATRRPRAQLPWREVSEISRALLISTVADLIGRRIITPGIRADGWAKLPDDDDYPPGWPGT